MFLLESSSPNLLALVTGMFGFSIFLFLFFLIGLIIFILLYAVGLWLLSKPLKFKKLVFFMHCLQLF